MIKNVKIVHITAMTILLGALSRLIPHPANFTALTALGILSGYHFKNIKHSAFVFFGSLIFADILIGFYTLMPVIYLVLTIPLIIGVKLKKSSKHKLLFGICGIFASSLSFFILTNFAVWLFTGMYSKSFDGLVSCYIAAIPFYKNQLCGDFFYSLLLFGLVYLLKQKFFVSNQIIQKI